MYSGLLEREFTEQQEIIGMPDFFLDLNLNQIVKELQNNADEYDIRKMFFRLPKDFETVCYRQEIYREIRGKHLEKQFDLFSRKMRETRQYLERHKGAEQKQQYQMYWFNAVSEFTDGVDLLRETLVEAKPESKGLAGLLTFVEELCGTSVWEECRKEKEKIKGMLSGLQFELSMDGTNLKVRARQREEYYFDHLKKLFPQKFSERTNADGIPYDYLIASPFVNNEQLGYLETEILRMYRKSRPEFFKALEQFYKKFDKMIEVEVYRIEEELQYYLTFSMFQKDMEAHGCVFSEPKVQKDGSAFVAHELYDLALARKNRWADLEVVSNSVQYREGERFFIVTGPNQGGKTTFARSLGQLVYFAMMGFTVPAESAVLPFFDNLLTHFSVEESLESGRGKLKEELVRLKPMMQEIEGNSFVVLNELFTTAATYDAFVMGQKVIRHFADQGCLGVYVTHIAELTKAGNDVVSLVALADEQDHKKRTFRVVRKEAEGIGYAGDIVDKHRLGYDELCKRLDEGGL
ncbi:MAG: hypothetical protein IJZ55_08050 [Lachnospiraceae bacterium]|nr:hypothetical protein [Lachnospiraceae bacterium]